MESTKRVLLLLVLSLAVSFIEADYFASKFYPPLQSTLTFVSCPNENSRIRWEVLAMNLQCSLDTLTVYDDTNGTIIFESRSQYCYADIGTVFYTSDIASIGFSSGYQGGGSYNISWTCETCGGFPFNKIYDVSTCRSSSDHRCVLLDIRDSQTHQPPFLAFSGLSNVVLSSANSVDESMLLWSTISPWVFNSPSALFGPLCTSCANFIDLNTTLSSGCFALASGSVTTKKSTFPCSSTSLSLKDIGTCAPSKKKSTKGLSTGGLIAITIIFSLIPICCIAGCVAMCIFSFGDTKSDSNQDVEMSFTPSTNAQTVTNSRANPSATFAPAPVPGYRATQPAAAFASEPVSAFAPVWNDRNVDASSSAVFPGLAPGAAPGAAYPGPSPAFAPAAFAPAAFAPATFAPAAFAPAAFAPAYPVAVAPAAFAPGYVPTQPQVDNTFSKLLADLRNENSEFRRLDMFNAQKKSLTRVSKEQASSIIDLFTMSTTRDDVFRALVLVMDQADLRAVIKLKVTSDFQQSVLLGSLGLN